MNNKDDWLEALFEIGMVLLLAILLSLIFGDYSHIIWHGELV